MPRPLAGCDETLKRFNEVLQRFKIYALSYQALHRFIEALQCFRIYVLSYEVLQRFIEAISNLTRPCSSRMAL